MKMIYIGEAPSRDIVIEGGAVHVDRGVPFEVPDSLAKSLLDQDIFEPAPAAKAEATKENG